MLTDTFGEFGAVICCDDIRQETNGKFVIVGMFTNGIIVEDFPAYLQPRLLVQYRAPDTGTQKLDFVWQLNDQPLVVMEGGVNQADRSQYVNICLPPAPLELPEQGTITVLARLENGDTREVLRKSLEKSDGPIPTI